jgi:DNA repair protein RecO (recombination protein O)
MPLVTTEAVVLHAFNYLESSRIYRLATREVGVVSVLAKGARRARTRYGSAVDLFAQGEARIYTKPNRELQNLAEFDVTRARAELADVPGRFTAAAALGELVMRFGGFGGEEPSPVVFESLVAGLDAVATAPAGGTADAALGAAWHLIAQLGFSPAVDVCSACHRTVPADEPAPFSHPGGGVLCSHCVGTAPSARRLPPAARAALRSWLAGSPAAAGDDGARRAHQRLLREFLSEHLGDGRELRAFAVWERGAWDAA